MLHPAIQIKDSPLGGKGLFTASLIKKGEVVWSLDTDEVQLTHDQVERLSAHDRSLAFQFNDRYIICRDGSEYMNHSCDPNTWWASDTEFAARRDIQPGEEITYDYVTADVTPPWKSTWRCSCGSLLCRTYIANTDCLEKSFQERFADHLPSWVEEYITSQPLSTHP